MEILPNGNIVALDHSNKQHELQPCFSKIVEAGKFKHYYSALEDLEPLEKDEKFMVFSSWIALHECNHSMLEGTSETFEKLCNSAIQMKNDTANSDTCPAVYTFKSQNEAEELCGLAESIKFKLIDGVFKPI